LSITKQQKKNNYVFDIYIMQYKYQWRIIYGFEVRNKNQTLEPKWLTITLEGYVLFYKFNKTKINNQSFFSIVFLLNLSM